MAVTAKVAKKITGGDFLIEDLAPEDMFTLEDLTAEQRQIRQLARDFAGNEILPLISSIEAKDYNVLRRLMRQAGALGLLGTDTPEQYDGVATDKVTSALIADNITVNASFTVTFSAHVSIGMLPLIWYGTPAQKDKYLPRLASGEWLAAYALSEASAGSDAMNIRTSAKLSPDGKHYVLNGEKMWISNGALANVFTIFAKIDGDKFSAFLVEKGTPGLTVGHEEHKLGIRGSSTCPLILSDCKVPAGNLLGEIGRGHQIAFNILNVGRYKLGASDVGAARNALQWAIAYAKDRVAFGKPITSFGLIQEKIADCAAAIYAGESLVYRVVGAIDAALSELDDQAPGYTKQVQDGIEEFAIECSIVKVWCSEMLGRVADQTLQMYGGYGFVEGYPAERIYRDARIERIYEGTNEINRLIIAGQLMKRSTRGRIALRPAIDRIMAEDGLYDAALPSSTPSALAAERALLASAKRLCLFCIGVALERHGGHLSEQQEIMAALADVMSEVLVIESAVLRAEKMGGKNGLASSLTKYVAARSFNLIQSAAERVIGACGQGDRLRAHRATLRKLMDHDLIDTIALGREIADVMIRAGGFTSSRGGV